jgi:hypothetical protein
MSNNKKTPLMLTAIKSRRVVKKLYPCLKNCFQLLLVVYVNRLNPFLIGLAEKKTGIQVTSKVRSYQGLMVHVFGRLAEAMFLLVFNS